MERSAYLSASLFVSYLLLTASTAAASEAGQGTFDVSLDDHPVHCSLGVPIVTGYTSTFRFDDKTFHVNMPPGNNVLEINFSVLGPFSSTGVYDCVFDEGGSFDAVATNEAGDFQWTEIKGETVDHKPGVSEGDPYPFVGAARCTTTRTDAFKTLCDNFTFSFNGLGKIGPETYPGVYHDSAGDFTLRAVMRVPVPVAPSSMDVHAEVDGQGGSLPEVAVEFRDGVAAPGELSVTTLAEARGVLPSGVDLVVRGTTEIDHGTGVPVPFFPGGDQRFVDVETDAVLPGRARLRVCLPMPPVSDPAEVRPVRLFHGEGPADGGRLFIDRTSETDPTTGQVCANVAGLSKFVVATTDFCGRGQAREDGLLTVAGGLAGRTTVVVAGLTDCTQYPVNLPRRLRRYCVPDTDLSTDRCTVSVTLGVNRGGCNRVAEGVDEYSAHVDVGSYRGTLRQTHEVTDLGTFFGPPIAALVGPLDATVGPVDLTLAVTKRVTTYKIKQEITGWRPGTTDLHTDKDRLKIRCIDPTRF